MLMFYRDMIVNKNSNTASALQAANTSIFKDANSDISNGQNAAHGSHG